MTSSPSPTDRQALKQRLASLLAAEMQQLHSFVSILEEERQILDSENAEPLFEIASRKAIQARQLQQFAHSRAAVLAQARLSQDRAGIETLLENPQHALWRTYLALAQQAQQLNQDNGQMITQRLSANHQALSVLLAYSDQPTTYGPDGSSRARPGSRHLGYG